MTRWRAGLAAAVILVIVYCGTLAPGVTFWDAGEFIAAAHALGIPHPPGTPLFVMMLSVWAKLLAFLPFAVATNLFSAVLTAVAGAFIALLVARGMLGREIGGGIPTARSGRAVDAFGIGAAVCAGSMFSVWSNGTETEVYAAALALAMITLWCAERAGRLDSNRWRVLTAYLFGIAIPLHISALVAAPSAVYLASSSPASPALDLRYASALTTAAVLAMAIGTMSPIFFACAGALLIATLSLRFRARRLSEPSRRPPVLPALVGAVLLGASAVAFLLVRARHDPSINQGNPSTWGALAAVIGRRQYDVAPLWPRRAPLWIQFGNWFEYADWQTALSLDPSVIPTVWRTLATVASVTVAIVGASHQRQVDRRGWLAVLILTVSGSLGVVAYLNLRAGPSFGWGVMPADALREARERDYFFVLGFVGWGIWTGIGAVALAQRAFRAPALGVLAAGLPILLNWSAVSRRHPPQAVEPKLFAHALLDAVPPNGVLFVAGDNDSYPLWYLQEVEKVRRDVTVVTLPLLAAAWYPAELARRHGLVPAGLSGRPADMATKIERSATQLGRPVAAAITVSSRERARLSTCWRLIGLVFVSTDDRNGVQRCSESPAGAIDGSAGATITIDSAAVAEWAARITAWLGDARPQQAIDPVDEYFFDVLSCPSHMLRPMAYTTRYASLDSLCNP